MVAMTLLSEKPRLGFERSTVTLHPGFEPGKSLTALRDNRSVVSGTYQTHVMGRWMSPDPYDGSYRLTNPQSFNRYSYARNNPMSRVDPSGLVDEDDVCADIVCFNGPDGGGGGGGGGSSPCLESDGCYNVSTTPPPSPTPDPSQCYACFLGSIPQPGQYVPPAPSNGNPKPTPAPTPVKTAICTPVFCPANEPATPDAPPLTPCGKIGAAGALVGILSLPFFGLPAAVGTGLTWLGAGLGIAGLGCL